MKDRHVGSRANPDDDIDFDSTPGDQLDAVLAVLLAILGLTGAVVAWQLGLASDAATSADDDGLSASRARTAAILENEGQIAQTKEAWLDYERDRRRAAALQEAGFPVEANNYWRQAAAHWFLVRPDYTDENGNYDEEAHREALFAGSRSRQDLEPDAHFERADERFDYISRLLAGGVVVAAALPFLTLASVVRGRDRPAYTLIGAVMLSVGVSLVVLSWF